MSKLTTTFNELREFSACESGYRTLAKHLGGVDAYGADTPIPLLTILTSNGVDDCLWSLRAAVEPERDYLARMIAADCAESVLHFVTAVRPDDNRPKLAIEAARAFARGETGDAARDAARDAAWAAARAAARDAAGDAAWDAAWAAAWDAAGDAAQAAAGDAAQAAAGAAARGAAWDAVRDAARDAAWAAARGAAWAAAGAAARGAAWAAAQIKERENQAIIIRAWLSAEVISA